MTRVIQKPMVAVNETISSVENLNNLVELAKTAMCQKNHKKALEYLVLAFRLKADDPSLYLLAAECCVPLNKIDLAIEFLSKGLQVIPGCLPLLTKLYELFRFQGRYKEALSLLEQFQKVFPDDAQVRREIDRMVSDTRRVFKQAETLKCRAGLAKWSRRGLRAPKILFTALPKSASEYIADSLVKGLGLDYFYIVEHYCPVKN